MTKAQKQGDEAAMTENDRKITKLCERVEQGQRMTKKKALPISEMFDPIYLSAQDWLDGLSLEQKKAIAVFTAIERNGNSNVLSALLENSLADSISELTRNQQGFMELFALSLWCREDAA